MALQYPGISYLKGYDGKISDIVDRFDAGLEAGRNSRDEANAGDLVAKLYALSNGGAQASPGMVAPMAPSDQMINSSFDAAAGAQDPALTAYFANTRRSESGGNDSAKNPNSSATGRYQFLDSTWQGLAQQYPELGLTPDGRNDPAQQEKAMKAFTMDNARQLQGSGIPVNPGTLYAAHFLGAGGASKVLSADPNTPVASLVGPEVVQANPQLANMTVGEFQQWAASKGGNGSGGYAGPVDPAGRMPAAGAAPRGIDPQLVSELFANRATRPLVAELFKNQSTAAKPTDDIAEYTFALGQGYRGTFEEWQKTNKAGVTVNNTTGGTSKFYDQLDQKLGEQVAAAIDAGQSATSNLQRLGQLEQYLSTAPQGAQGAIVQFAGSIGIPSEGLDDIQAAQAIINQLVPLQRPPGSGTMSDADLELYKKSLPSILNQKGGNQQIIETTRAINQYAVEQAKIAQMVANREIDPAEGRRRQAAVPNPLAEFQSGGGAATGQAPAAPVAVTDQAGYDALPSGTQYKAPDGTIRVKP